MLFLLGPKKCGCGSSGVREGACRCSHSNTFSAEAYRTLSILKIIGVILVTFYELGALLGTPGPTWALLWALLGSPGLNLALLALLGVSWGSPGSPGAPFCGFGQGGWEGSFLIAICFQNDLKPVLVTPGAFWDLFWGWLCVVIRVFTSDSIVILAFECLSSMPNSHFDLGFYSAVWRLNGLWA